MVGMSTAVCNHEYDMVHDNCRKCGLEWSKFPKPKYNPLPSFTDAVRSDLHREVHYGIREYPGAFLFTALTAFNLGLALGVVVGLLV
jgi:hypothetical protein